MKAKTIRGMSSFDGVIFIPLFLPAGAVILFSALISGQSELSYTVARSRVLQAEGLIARFLARHGLCVADNDEPEVVYHCDGSASVELLVFYEPSGDVEDVNLALRHCSRILQRSSIAA
ncbi:MAG: hypothetical protein WCP91_00755 [Candidatus Berkelbacteria bacterium]